MSPKKHRLRSSAIDNNNLLFLYAYGLNILFPRRYHPGTYMELTVVIEPIPAFLSMFMNVLNYNCLCYLKLQKHHQIGAPLEMTQMKMKISLFYDFRKVHKME